MSSAELTSSAWNHLTLCHEAMASHCPRSSFREIERKAAGGGVGWVRFEEEGGKKFLLEKNIALSMRKARFMCCEKGAWAVT